MNNLLLSTFAEQTIASAPMHALRRITFSSNLSTLADNGREMIYWRKQCEAALWPRENER